MTQNFRIGSRGSELALRQTHLIIGMLQTSHPGSTFEIVEITTPCDRFGETPISEMGAHIDRGIFNSGLEEALLEKQVDLVTCSFKDVESDLPAGLIAIPVGKREDPRDVLLTRHGLSLAQLPPGAVLATSSPRRVSQLRAFRPDFAFHSLRGNLTTRAGEALELYDGVIVAAAGLVRLGLEEKITEWLAPEILLPAPAQAAMGCEYLEGREDIARLVAPIRDQATELCVTTEKKLLVTLSGGCFAPIGALATLEGERLRLRCRIVSLDGERVSEAEDDAPPAEKEQLVERMAARLKEQGGVEIIEETREALQGA